MAAQAYDLGSKVVFETSVVVVVVMSGGSMIFQAQKRVLSCAYIAVVGQRLVVGSSEIVQYVAISCCDSCRHRFV